MGIRRRLRLIPLVYYELHRLAHQHMRRERAGHMLQTSALINEAYLRLVDQPEVTFENRAHFFGIAERLMRQILVDEARKRNSAKRGEARFRYLWRQQQVWPRNKPLTLSQSMMH